MENNSRVAKQREKTKLEVQEELERASCPACIAYRCTPQKNGRIIPIRPTDFKRELDGRNLNLLKMQSKESKNSGRRIDVRELVLARLAYAAESVESLFLATRLREDARSLSGRSVEAE